MYNKIISIFLVIILLFTSFNIVFAEDNIKVILNGEEIFFDVHPQSIDGRTMVPMRKIFESMGAVVNWDNDSQIITAVKYDITVIMQINNPIIRVNNEEITLDVPPQIVDTRTLVPVRAVAESFDADVTWDGESKTVVITDKFVDLNESTEFLCITNPTYLYGIEDVWYETVGTDFMPALIPKEKAYRGQVVIISPVYANYAIDDSGCANVTFDIKIKYPSGEEAVIGTGIPAFNGRTDPNYFIKSIHNIEYMLEESDDLGTYTFTIESKDHVANKTYTNIVDIEFVEYKYIKNEFSSLDELLTYISLYGQNPNPDRIIDAIIYAEKNNILYYPMIFGGLLEMYAKNPYISIEAITQFEREFGSGGTEMLLLLDNTAAEYYQNILSNNPPTITYVSYIDDIAGEIYSYGFNLGIYFASSSYDTAVALAESYAKDDFSNEIMEEYAIPKFEDVFEWDMLLRAYCYRMVHYDNQVSNIAKAKLQELFN